MSVDISIGKKNRVISTDPALKVPNIILLPIRCHTLQPSRGSSASWFQLILKPRTC